jgi:hypothetical protein
VAARTRQLNHRLKGRKQAILDRRATASPKPPVRRPASPSNVALMNGGTAALPNVPQPHPSQTSPGGFVAVNARPHQESNGNGTSSTTRHDLLSKFHTMSERRPSSQPSNGSSADTRRPSISGHGISHPSTPVMNVSRAPSKPAELAPTNPVRPSHLNESELHSMMNSPVPIPNTPTNLLPAVTQRNSQSQEKDDGGPFKAEMVHKMETLAKGERILPPCDRCRRLHMDCLKNLTACMGCTKKHAKCSWKEVREIELRGNYAHPLATNSNVHSETSDHESGDRASTASPAAMLSPPRHALTPSNVASSNDGHTPQHVPHHSTGFQSDHQQLEHHRPHPSTEPHSHYDLPHNARIPPSRHSPPERDRSREGNVEVQLQEAAKSGLAHATGNGHPRLGSAEGKGSDHYQTMVV